MNPYYNQSDPFASNERATIPIPMRYEFFRLCDDILSHIDVVAASKNDYLENARRYALAGKTLASVATSPQNLTVQALYILTNLQFWRHPSAKSLRDRLRAFSQQK